MTATRIVRVATVTAAAAAGVAAAALLWRTRVPAELRLPEVRARDVFAAGELERIEDYRGPQRLLLLASIGAELTVLTLAALRSTSLADRAHRLARGRIRAGIAVALAVVLAVWLTRLPLDAAAHRRRRRFGLSEQSYAGWLRDEVVALGVLAVLVALAVAGAMAIAARTGRRWWVFAVPSVTLAAAAFVLLQPIAIAPLFNRFEPLRDRELERRIDEVARRLDVEVETIEVADASRRTTAANAYVAGIGPSRRVVLYDTTLREFEQGELVSIAAHELAHVSRAHLWKGIAWFGLLAVPALFLVARAAERRGGASEPAAVPVALLVVTVFSLATLPLQNAVSRRYEAEADWLALEATRDPASAVALDRRLVRTNLGDPDPPAWVTFWFGTHPPALERIAMAEAWRLKSGSAGDFRQTRDSRATRGSASREGS